MSAWSVSIRSYEGPLDLLLYTISKKDLNIRDISISEIADQYVAHLEELGIGEVDLNEASEFLDLATRLMELKARELNIGEARSDEEIFQFDEDREQFFREIEAYKAYKEMAGGLRDFETVERRTFGRGRPENFGRSDEEISCKEAGIFQLYDAYYRAMRASSADGGGPVHTIDLDYYPLEDAKQNVSNLLHRRGRAAFDDLVGADPTPLVSTTTFQALLDMVKTEDVVLRQVNLQSLLWSYRKRDNDEYYDEISSSAHVEAPTYDAPLKEGLVDYIRRHVAEMGDKLGIDGILDELTKRVSEGGAVREVDLDHVLAGGTLATMPSALGLVPDDEPASGEPAEEGAVAEPEEGETDGTGAPVDRAVGTADPDDEADSAPGELTGVPDGFGETADDGSGAIDPEDAVVDDSDVSDEEGAEEAEGEDPDEETGESGENFDNFFD